MSDKTVSVHQSNFAVDFLAGGTAAAISKTAAAPIERVKLLIQNQGAMINSGRLTHPYNGITDAFIRTYRGEGLKSFWRGNIANIIRYFPTQAINFSAKDTFKRTFGYKKSEGFGLWVAGNVASGAAAGATSSIFVYSLDFARTRLAADGKKGGQRQYQGLIDVYKQTLKTDGVVGLYRGFVPSLFGIVVYRGLYFGGYDTIKDLVLQGDMKGNFLASFAVGYACTTGASLASYPFDTIRRRMMMSSGEAVKYKSFIHAGREIIAKEGVKALFGGAFANILRGVAAAGTLALYDKFQELAWGHAYSSGSG
ncbi:hypothetical protein Clacol_007652 [Clathrus columnatus]|uniref:ADP/ATP translocase n=1 Tax=Clathrus columnatus TaxID=1419009 RepID=A0AAV5AIQ5_9AGAM|nr:hypothetical protein Clacol_007652 [Clathrus columnatus]